MATLYRSHGVSTILPLSAYTSQAIAICREPTCAEAPSRKDSPKKHQRVDGWIVETVRTLPPRLNNRALAQTKQQPLSTDPKSSPQAARWTRTTAEPSSRDCRVTACRWVDASHCSWKRSYQFDRRTPTVASGNGGDCRSALQRG
jgi:hypothetical protein